ncbi:Peroxidase 48 [Pyrus ussuriensis x Pyrus communis]|uniref:Peroxidase 48 n=1 Tax=Pyrus ussuriensis x Pyrus communis TaxID=2448454 RepID=A0A5N5HLV9_9ROSA|nr:Peroxidase 48 [Pyrus ussuriensis x Pyrus communis]
MKEMNDGGQSDLKYDFYRETCPETETIVRLTMAQIYSHLKNVFAQLLRLFFHDYFIQVYPNPKFFFSLSLWLFLIWVLF